MRHRHSTSTGLPSTSFCSGHDLHEKSAAKHVDDADCSAARLAGGQLHGHATGSISWSRPRPVATAPLRSPIGWLPTTLPLVEQWTSSAPRGGGGPPLKDPKWPRERAGWAYNLFGNETGLFRCHERNGRNCLIFFLLFSVLAITLPLLLEDFFYSFFSADPCPSIVLLLLFFM